MSVIERRCVGRCCDNRPGWEWVENPVTHAREKRRQVPQPGQHGTEGHECQPRMAADGAYLCHGCIRWLTEIVHSLPSYADDLESAATHSASSTAGTLRAKPRPTDNWGRTGVKGDKRGEASPDLGQQRHRIEALRQLAHDAGWWALLVADERGLTTLPPMDTVDAPRRAVHAAAGFISAHVDWLAARASADETLAAFRTMRHDAARAMDLPRDRSRFTVGPCPEDCEGTVWAYIGTESDDTAMGCDLVAEHSWEPKQFYRAGVRIKRKIEGAA